MLALSTKSRRSSVAGSWWFGEYDSPAAATKHICRCIGFSRCGSPVHYRHIPLGPPAILHAYIRNEVAVRSIAGSSVEYDCTLSL